MSVEAPSAPQDREAYITELIVAKHAAQRRISELEDTVATLRQQLEQKHACDDESISEMHGEAAARRPTSAPAQEAVLKRGSLDQIHRWNKELVRTVEKLQRAMIHLETDSKGQLVLLTDELAKIVDENAQLRHENDSLKERVADDVLRQRQANRIEMASEKARIASQVRQAGKRRLESMEAVLMEAHDDLYHVQRWDAGVAPQRDVNFVFHYVSNISFPSLNAVEDFVMNVYKEILLNTCRKLEGYRVFSYRGMEVFAFQRATVALEFAKACHEQIATLSWPERSKTLPYFATIAQYGEVLFQGPRMHTCIYACTPQCTIDPASGRALYFGNETRAAVEAALKLSAVGEIVANDVWARLVCMELRVSANSSSPVIGNVMDVRTSLGKGWDVIGMPGSLSIICSILPDSLKARRGVEFHLLSPTPKYPSMLVQVDEVLEAIVGGMRSIAAEPSGKKMLALMSSSGSDAALSEGADDVDHAGLLLKFYSMKQDRDKLITMYQNTEKLCAALEKKNMEGEDRFQKSKQKPLDTAETAYVCTVDTGDDSVWKKILISSISAEEYEEIRNTIRAHINSAAKHYYGFLMNGNNYDIFTYVFREVEQAIAFVSEVYIKVNRTGTKCSYVTQGSSEEVFLMRAGISGGSMSTIYRTRENDTVKCTGPIIRLSGTLCDLSQDGEILAMDDVVRAFHRKNENLLDTQYNIVKQPGKFVGGFDTSAVVHSILPKPFAYRRQKLMNTTGTTTNRSASAALMVIKTHFPRQDVAEALTQVLERLERTETARMESEDLYAHSQPLKQLANTWMFVKQRTTATPSATGTPASSRRNSTASLSAGSAVGAPTDADATELHSLAFLMCDVVGIAALGRELGEVILTRVLRHYNFIVQEIFGQCRGCIIKTNSRAAYIVAFEDGCLALEAATLIQQRLLRSDWPEELHTLEPSLRVRDSKSGIFLFHGVRAQVAVHYSNKFGWKKISTEDGPTRVDVFGLAMEELLTIARFTHGGEIRLSRPLLKNVAGTTTGKLLTDQLEMEIVSIPQTLDELPRAMPKKGRRSSAGGHGPRSISRSSRSFSIGEDDCITAVPKLLHGRFSIIPNHRRRSMRGSIGGGGAAIIASPPSSPPKPISAKEVERVSPAASLTKSQGMWCSQAQGENPLPTAEFVDWQRTDISVSMHPEVEEIQRAATELLALFPMELTECAAQVFANLSTTELSYTLFLRYSRDLIHFVKTAAQVGSGILKAPSLAKDGAPGDVVFPVSSVVRTLPPMMKGGVNVPHPPANSRASRGANSGGGSYASGGGGSSTASSKSSYDPYRAALNFMDDACRYLSTQSGTALGKLTTIPSAPPSKFSRSNGRRAL